MNISPGGLSAVGEWGESKKWEEEKETKPAKRVFSWGQDEKRNGERATWIRRRGSGEEGNFGVNTVDMKIYRRTARKNKQRDKNAQMDSQDEQVDRLEPSMWPTLWPCTHSCGIKLDTYSLCASAFVRRSSWQIRQMNWLRDTLIHLCIIQHH